MFQFNPCKPCCSSGPSYCPMCCTGILPQTTLYMEGNRGCGSTPSPYRYFSSKLDWNGTQQAWIGNLDNLNPDAPNPSEFTQLKLVCDHSHNPGGGVQDCCRNLRLYWLDGAGHSTAFAAVSHATGEPVTCICHELDGPCFSPPDPYLGSCFATQPNIDFIDPLIATGDHAYGGSMNLSFVSDALRFDGCFDFDCKKTLHATIQNIQGASCWDGATFTLTADYLIGGFYTWSSPAWYSAGYWDNPLYNQGCPGGCTAFSSSSGVALFLVEGQPFNCACGPAYSLYFGNRYFPGIPFRHVESFGGYGKPTSCSPFHIEIYCSGASIVPCNDNTPTMPIVKVTITE